MTNVTKHINKYNGNLVISYVTENGTFVLEIDAYGRTSTETTTSYSFVNSICNFNATSYLLATKTKNIALLSLGSINETFVDISPYKIEQIIKIDNYYLLLDSSQNKLIKCSIDYVGNFTILWDLNLSFSPIDARIQLNEDLIYISKGNSLYIFKDNDTFVSLLNESELDGDADFVVRSSLPNAISYLEYSVKDLGKLNLDVSSSSSSSFEYSSSSSSS